MSTPETTATPLRLLEERARDLQAGIAAAQQLAERQHEVSDRKDDAADSAMAEVSGAEVERDMAELREIERARERIREGRYGICEDCGEPIDAARLRVRRSATRCVMCQQTAEYGLRPVTSG